VNGSASADGSRAASGHPRLLNLGCGDEGHPAFVNVDLNSHPGVIQHDLRRGIPFPDASFDLVYHATMISLFRAPEAVKLMRECLRVLKPGGVLRVVTEDLERMCRVYLEKVEAAWKGDGPSSHDHEWMMLELYSQAISERPGEGMAGYLMQQPIPNEAFIFERVGDQGRQLIAGVRRFQESPGEASPPPPQQPAARRLADWGKQKLLMAFLGAERLDALNVGRWRLKSGTVSYRMYDRYSLRKLFLDAGFADVALQTATTSASPFWIGANLDLTSTGQAARPHTLIMEGRRPAHAR
jgi:hypothetical protein